MCWYFSLNTYRPYRILVYFTHFAYYQYAVLFSWSEKCVFVVEVGMLNTFYNCEETNNLTFCMDFTNVALGKHQRVMSSKAINLGHRWNGYGTCKIVQKVRENTFMYTHLHRVCIDKNIPGPQPLSFAGGSCWYLGMGKRAGWSTDSATPKGPKQSKTMPSGRTFLCRTSIFVPPTNLLELQLWILWCFFLREICQIYVPIDILTLSPCLCLCPCFFPVTWQGGLLGRRHDWRFGQSGFEGRKWFHAVGHREWIVFVELWRVLEISSPCYSYIVWIQTICMDGCFLVKQSNEL